MGGRLAFLCARLPVDLAPSHRPSRQRATTVIDVGEVTAERANKLPSLFCPTFTCFVGFTDSVVSIA